MPTTMILILKNKSEGDRFKWLTETREATAKQLVGLQTIGSVIVLLSEGHNNIYTPVFTMNR
jgi:hypothetical protein